MQCFEPPPEQKVEPGRSNDYIGVYCVGSHITVVTKQPLGFSFPKVELWSPIFECPIPLEIRSAEAVATSPFGSEAFRVSEGATAALASERCVSLALHALSRGES